MADGVAFSASQVKFTPASLKFVFDEIERTVYPSGGYVRDQDLKRWSNQGILLINTALTTTIGKTGMHYSLWQPFIAFLLDTLAFNKASLCYGFMGKVAQKWADSVPENNYKVLATHPASAAHQNSEKWDSESFFLKVRDFVKKNYNEDIIW